MREDKTNDKLFFALIGFVVAAVPAIIVVEVKVVDEERLDREVTRLHLLSDTQRETIEFKDSRIDYLTRALGGPGPAPSLTTTLQVTPECGDYTKLVGVGEAAVVLRQGMRSGCAIDVKTTAGVP